MVAESDASPPPEDRSERDDSGEIASGEIASDQDASHHRLEYPLGPEILEEAEVSARELAMRRLAQAMAQLDRESQPDRTDLQIPLSFVLQLFVAASVLLAVGRVLPRGVFAGVCGVVGLVWLIIDSFFAIRSLRVELAWWTLMATYLAAVCFAMLSE